MKVSLNDLKFGDLCYLPEEKNKSLRMKIKLEGIAKNTWDSSYVVCLDDGTVEELFYCHPVIEITK